MHEELLRQFSRCNESVAVLAVQLDANTESTALKIQRFAKMHNTELQSLFSNSALLGNIRPMLVVSTAANISVIPSI